MVLGLDISARHVGYAILVGRRLRTYGCYNLKTGRKSAPDETSYEFAIRVTNGLKKATGKQRARVCYEVNYMPARGRTRGMRFKRMKDIWKVVLMIGRVLQELGVVGEAILVDKKKKLVRKAEMQAIYEVAGLNEHEADALAIAHRASAR